MQRYVKETAKCLVWFVYPEPDCSNGSNLDQGIFFVLAVLKSHHATDSKDHAEE